MSSSSQKKQKFIRYFLEKTGATEWTNHDVALFAVKMGWPLPKPAEPIDLLARQFGDAAREETREDATTKKIYKANLAFAKRLNGKGKQEWLFCDVDTAPRPQMESGLHWYREQMVSEAVIAVNTSDHWNRNHPDQIPLAFVADLTADVLERDLAPGRYEDADEDEAAS